MKKACTLLFPLFFIQYSISAQNVGIGTITPEGILHVKGTNWTKAILENNTGEARDYIGTDNNGTITIGANAYWNGSNWVYPNTGSSMYLLLHRGTNQFEFRVRPDGGAQSTPMVIEVGGNVGVGTTNPQQNLSVGSGMVVDQNNTNTGTAAGMLSFGTFSGEGIGSKRNAGPGQYGLDFYTLSTNRMTISNNGNVGIGTVNPQQNLSVGGALVIDQNNANTGTAATMLSFGSNSGEGIGSKRNSGTNQYGLDFYTDSTRRISITHQGLVGIGVNNPQSMLTIKHGGIVYDNTPPWGKHAIAIWDSSYNLSSVAMLMGTQNTLGVGYIHVEKVGSTGIPSQTKLVLNVHGDPVIIGGAFWSNTPIPQKLLVMGHALAEGDIEARLNLIAGMSLSVNGNITAGGNTTLAGLLTVNNTVAASSANISGNLTVSGNKGIIRSNSATQLKYVVTTTQVTRAAVLQNTFTDHTVNWSENFSSNPVTAYLADIPGGFGFELLDIKIRNVTTTGCTVVISNSTQTPIPCDFTLKIVAIGPQ